MIFFKRLLMTSLLLSGTALGMQTNKKIPLLIPIKNDHPITINLKTGDIGPALLDGNIVWRDRNGQWLVVIESVTSSINWPVTKIVSQKIEACLKKDWIEFHILKHVFTPWKDVVVLQEKEGFVFHFFYNSCPEEKIPETIQHLLEEYNTHRNE